MSNSHNLHQLPPGLAEQVQTPALVIFMADVRHNIATVIEHIGDVDRWRPHVKTTKIPRVFEAMLEAGVRHFKCATTRELEQLLLAIEHLQINDADVLLAHHPIGPAKARMEALVKAHPRTRCSMLVEDVVAASTLPLNVDCFVDVHSGMERTGLPIEDIHGINAVHEAAGERCRGLHVYDGQFHGLDCESRRRAAHARYGEVIGLVDTIGFRGELVTSGTPTFLDAIAYAPFACHADLVHRVSPGTVVFTDTRSDEEQPALKLAHAACILTRIISHPADQVVTCDAGSKSIAADAGDPCAIVEGAPGLVARTPSEEHLPFDVMEGGMPPRGTTLLLVPRHVCPSVNLHEEALLVEADGSWSSVDVTARAHDVL